MTGMTEVPIHWPIAKGGRGRHWLVSGRPSAKGERRAGTSGQVIVAASTGGRMTRPDGTAAGGLE
jgi:hypothetical protein